MSREFGTKMWCPSCKRNQPCKSLKKSETECRDELLGSCYRTDQPDLHYYRRIRLCEECDRRLSFGWPTIEIEERFLDELVRLRNTVKTIKEKAEQYIKDADDASMSIRELSASLSGLLDINVLEDEGEGELNLTLSDVFASLEEIEAGALEDMGGPSVEEESPG